MLGRLVNDELSRTDPAYPWGDTLPVLRQADLRIGNLECVLAEDGKPWPDKVFRFRSDRKNIESLKIADFGVVSLANNHVLDYGADALRETISTLDQHQVLHAGAGIDRDACRLPAAWHKNNTPVGFVAITDNEPGWEAGTQAPGVHYVPIDLKDDRALELLALVRRLASQVRLVIVSAHWGSNWGWNVPAEHQAFAHALIDAGADVIYGHSAHVFRGVEVYRNKPILYSTGDFVDDYAVDPIERNDESFIFLLEAHGGVPAELRLYPTVISEYRATLARGSARGIARRMQELSTDLGTRSSWLDDERCLLIRLRETVSSPTG
jgi:poly-gamma-glutamate synthesis protein (capsule biosynthesis protein)